MATQIKDQAGASQGSHCSSACEILLLAAAPSVREQYTWRVVVCCYDSSGDMLIAGFYGNRILSSCHNASVTVYLVMRPTRSSIPSNMMIASLGTSAVPYTSRQEARTA